jgi:FdhE protein
LSPAQIRMPWSTGAIRTAAGLPGAIEAQVEPAWQPWIDLLDVALEEANGHAWKSTTSVRAERENGAPALHGAVLHIDALRAKRLLRRLAELAGVRASGEMDARAAIRAAISRDERALAELAERCDASIDAFAVVAQVAAMPLLMEVESTLEPHAASTWQRGYCPVCGAWPSLAEIRGIERERRLRCGCCSADWPLPLLHCPFCEELDHGRLGTLQPEGEEQLWRAERCETCHGYLKAVMTYGALSVRALVLLDLTTIPLDLVAQQRGYARPARPGWAPRVEIAP